MFGNVQLGWNGFDGTDRRVDPDQATLTASHVITPIGVAGFEAVGSYTTEGERISFLPDSSTIKNASDENCSAKR